MALFAAPSGVPINDIDIPYLIIIGPLYLPFLCLVVYLIYACSSAAAAAAA